MRSKVRSLDVIDGEPYGSNSNSFERELGLERSYPVGSRNSVLETSSCLIGERAAAEEGKNICVDRRGDFLKEESWTHVIRKKGKDDS